MNFMHLATTAYSTVQNRFAQLPARFTAFVDSLSQSELARLYKSHGRIWLDTGDFEFRLTFGPPTDRGAHSWMREEPSAGIWVSLGLHMPTHEDHQCDEDGVPIDWVPSAGWVHDELHCIRDDFLESLLCVIETAEEQS